MKKTIVGMILVGFFYTVQGAGDPHLTSDERAKAVQLLIDSQQEFLDAVENLSEVQWSYKPAPDRWSIGDVAEHILLAEGLLFSAVQAALAAQPNPEWETKTAGKTEFLEKVLVNRTTKAQAPEPLQPSGKLTRAEIISRFKEVRATTLKFAQETNAPLKEHTLDHPAPAFGTLSAYQWLVYIPLHHRRHNQQIAEVKAAADFPK